MALLVTMSCSKSNDDGGETPTPAVEEGKTFNAFIKDGFTGDKGEELLQPRNLKNIRVGDFIPYTLTITDTDLKSGEQFALFAIKEEDKNHQSMRVDYDIYLEDENGKKQKVEDPKITFKKEGKYKFYIRPLVPGTFQLPFLFQKEGVGEIKLPKVNFSAVKITAWSWARRDRWVWKGFPIPEQWSVNKRDYKFIIDDGDNETDIYLTPLQASQHFEIYYNGNKASGSFVVNNQYDFHPEQERERADPPLPAPVVTITIVQRREGKEEYRITYNNVYIENRY